LAGALKEGGHTVIVVDAIGLAPHQFLEAPHEQFLVHGLAIPEIVENIPKDTDVIGLSCMFSHEWPLIRDLADAIREQSPAALIVAGGEHITALPAESLSDCSAIDVGIIGEGEETLLAVLDAFNGDRNLGEIEGVCVRADTEIRISTPRSRIRDLESLPAPDWHTIPLNAYLDNGFGFGVNRGRSMPVLATRGCPYRCTFCSNPAMWGTRWVSRAPAEVLEEMLRYKSEYNIQNFDFYDLTAIVKKSWIVEFCQLIIASGVQFTWQLPSGTRSEAIDEEVSQLLFESGCRNMSYAPESGSDTVLERIKKKIDLDSMIESMQSAIKSGINCKANIIIGFPGESHREVFQTMRFVARCAFIGLHDLSISPFSPYPGSELFQDMQRSGQVKELSDEYYYSLATYTDLRTTLSMSEKISDKALGRYRILGMLLFYVVQYLVRPLRVLTTLRNVMSVTQESRLEMSLRDLYIRLFGKPAREGTKAP